MAAAGFGDSIEGIHAVRAALEAGRVLHAIFETRRAERGELADLVTDMRSGGVGIGYVDDLRPLAFTTAPQGVVAKCTPRQPVDLFDLVDEATPASLLLIDHVEDPHNVGAIVRSAVAAGMPRIALPGRRSAPLSAAAFKASAGALEVCSVAFVSSVADAMLRLSDRGVWTVALDSDGGRPLFGLDLLTEPVALVVGGETGLARLVKERADVVASIPMSSDTESLNTSVAAALACFEVQRVRASI